MNPMKSYINIINEAQQNNAIYEEFHRVGSMMVEYKLTPDQITQVFQQVQAGATAAGGNRTMIGKGVDAASAVSQAFDKVKAKIASSGPVAGFDEKFAGMQQKLATAAGGESGPVMKALRQYQQFAKAHPVMQGVIYSGLIALAGLSGAGLGAAAILGGIKMFDKLLQGDKFSSALWQGFKTGATSAAAGAIGGSAQDAANQAAAAASDQGMGTISAAQAAQDTATQTAAAASDQGMGTISAQQAAQDTANQTAAAASDQGNLGTATSDAAATQQAAASSDAGNLGGGAPGKDYTVKRGDTLSAIAQKNKVSVADLMKANPEITNPNVINAGQHIQVPAATGNSIYQGGVGTAADTAKKVASGAYQAQRGMAESTFKFVGLPVYEMVDFQKTKDLEYLNESLGVQDDSLVLTEAGVGAVLYNIVALHHHLTEAGEPGVAAEPAKPGLFSRMGSAIKNSSLGQAVQKGVAAVGQKAATVGQNMTTKITADKLQRAWQAAGSPMDTAELKAFLVKQGVDAAVIDNTYKQLKLTRTGGKVAGQVSQTPGAIRKRDARAAARAGGAAPAAAPQPMATAGSATATTGAVGGAAKPRINVGRAATGPAPAAAAPQPAVQAAPAQQPAKPQSVRAQSQLRNKKPAPQQVAASFDNPNIGKLIAEAEGLYKLAAFAPAEKKNSLLAEAANAAKQAAIAINMKKTGKKPKNDEAVEMDQPVEEAEKKGLYYYVNKRKKAGTSRSKDNPKAPSEQDWKDAAKTAKK